MTVTINTLGANSRQIVITGETSATNIINAVNTSLTALGWTLIDTVTSGSRGLLTTKVYSAPNADTVTTKYMIIRYDLARQYWFVSCAENWNTTTNVATNECWYGNRQILLPLQYSNCIFYIFASARYAAFMGVVQGEPSPWQGIFEFQREAPEDIATNSVPCFGWTSSLTIGEPYGNFASPASAATSSTNNGYVAVGFAVPRTVNGLTGASAAGVFTILSTIGTYPPVLGQVGVDFTSGGVTSTLNSHHAMLGSFGEGQSYVWNNTKTLISNIKLTGYSTNYVIGRIYGLKITTKLGAVLDTSSVPVDANLFYSATGTPTTHYLLGINGEYADRLTSKTNFLNANITNSPNAFGACWQTVFVSGRFMYFTTSTGFHKFDAQTQGITFNILPAAAYYSVKFDGENSLYVTGATANLVYKVNLSDDTYTSLSMTGNWLSLALDDDNLYVGSSAAAASVVVKKVALSNFLETASYTVTTPGAGNYITQFITDYTGNLYIGFYLSYTASSNRIVKMTTSNGNQVFISPTVTLAINSFIGAQPAWIDDSYLYILTGENWTSGGGANPAQVKITRIKLSNFTIDLESFRDWGISAVNGFYNTSGIIALGSSEIIFFGGVASVPFHNLNSYRLVLSDPRFPLTNGIPNIVNNFPDSTNSSQGQYCTDQCNLYMVASTTRIIKYNAAFRNYNFNGVQSSNILIAQ